MALLKTVKYLFILSVLLLFSFLAFLFIDTYGYKEHLDNVIFYSNKYGVDKNLVLAVMKTESNFKTNALSSKGAVGIMQIMPKTAEFISRELNRESYDLKDEKTSIEFGVYYISYLSKKFKNEHEVICAYNAGEGKVFNWISQKVISKNKTPYKETTNYLKLVKLRKFLFNLIVK